MRWRSTPVIAVLLWLPVVFGRSQQTGRIFGHVYRADTGTPLAGVTVSLASPALSKTIVKQSQTAQDGSYRLVGFPAGNDYSVSAFKAGFTPAVYGLDRSGTLMPLTIGQGEARDNIDLKVNPVASVTQMDDAALAPAYSEERLYLRFGVGRFSTDGTLLAFTVGDPDPSQVWLYDLSSRHLTPVTEQPPPTGGLAVLDMAWSGDTLYAETRDITNRVQYFQATVASTKAISEIPAEAEAPLRHEALRLAFGSAGNDLFVVAAENQGHGDFTLRAKVTAGQKKYVIANGGWELDSFVFVPDRSLVLYPEWSPYMYGAIVTFDLNTRQSKRTYLPVRPETLLDARAEPQGFLVAYATYGPCESGGETSQNQPNDAHLPSNVCFAEVPFKGSSRGALVGLRRN